MQRTKRVIVDANPGIVSSLKSVSKVEGNEGLVERRLLFHPVEEENRTGYLEAIASSVPDLGDSRIPNSKKVRLIEDLAIASTSVIFLRERRFADNGDDTGSR